MGLADRTHDRDWWHVHSPQDQYKAVERLGSALRHSLSQAVKLKPTTAQTQTLYWIHRSADKRIYIYSNADGAQTNLLGYIPLQGV